MSLIDTCGRRIDYLRIAVTEQCNFRCTYCVPPQGVACNMDKQLSCDAILRFVRIAAELGIRKVRLTGGEPLLREDLLAIVRGIAETPGIEDLSLTTNGSRLGPLLRPLVDAGLKRINISLDSLNRQRFKTITQVDAADAVLASCLEAVSLGLPVKLNTVVLPDLTPQEAVNLAKMAMVHPLDVRFLEFMPLCGSAWSAQQVIPIATVRSWIQQAYSLVPVERGSSPAQTFKLAEGLGRVGFIGSLTESFCERCSRLRLLADGRLRPCLFSQQEIEVAPLLLPGSPDHCIADAIRQAVAGKPLGNEYRQAPFLPSASPEHVLLNPAIRLIGG